MENTKNKRQKYCANNNSESSIHIRQRSIYKNLITSYGSDVHCAVHMSHVNDNSDQIPFALNFAKKFDVLHHTICSAASGFRAVAAAATFIHNFHCRFIAKRERNYMETPDTYNTHSSTSRAIYFIVVESPLVSSSNNSTTQL